VVVEPLEDKDYAPFSPQYVGLNPCEEARRILFFKCAVLHSLRPYDERRFHYSQGWLQIRAAVTRKKI
jgi:hypothetical protein